MPRKLIGRAARKRTHDRARREAKRMNTDCAVEIPSTIFADATTAIEFHRAASVRRAATDPAADEHWKTVADVEYKAATGALIAMLLRGAGNAPLPEHLALLQVASIQACSTLCDNAATAADRGFWRRQIAALAHMGAPSRPEKALGIAAAAGSGPQRPSEAFHHAIVLLTAAAGEIALSSRSSATADYIVDAHRRHLAAVEQLRNIMMAPVPDMDDAIEAHRAASVELAQLDERTPFIERVAAQTRYDAAAAAIRDAAAMRRVRKPMPEGESDPSGTAIEPKRGRRI
ncbi:MAG: hypothetical protein IBJ15_02155 [Alphaproteobacteria bacterium]|nr:hypothetical protein [Alphaproteobacteria bacterium]